MKSLVTALLILVAACGEGRAIFNVDVLSFLPDSTQPYNVPGVGVTVADSGVLHTYLPPGFGSSSVDSVTTSLIASVENTGGSGSVILAVYFSKDSAQVFAGTPYLVDSSGPVSGVQTVQMAKNTISLSDSVFNTTDLWLGIRAEVTSNVGPNMTGQLRFNDLHLRVVLQDKVF